MKLGIAGSGHIVETVLPVLESLEIRPAALCGTARSRGKVEQLCGRYGIPLGTSSYEELLSSPDVDTVYLGIPNSLHYSFAKRAFQAGKHVISEKPLTSNLREAEALFSLAEEKGLMLLEAISTLFLPDYRTVGALLPRVGRVRLVSCNYSQYSSRYRAFTEGDVKPAFDPAKSGGALMDLNVYNIHYITGLFGAPKGVSYQANIERGIDTSGVVILEYPDFVAAAAAAKDCGAPCFCRIQGTEGYLLQNSPSNTCAGYELTLNDGTTESGRTGCGHRLCAEFLRFREMIDGEAFGECRKLAAHSLVVMDVLDRARRSAGLVFPADRETED